MPENGNGYRGYSSSDGMSRVTQLKSVQTEAREVFERKNKDYGDAFARYGPVGVLVRLGDKLARLQNISRNGVTIDVQDESARDTLLDLHNYSAMAIMLLDEDDPKPLRAWRISTGVVQANGTMEVIVRETRDTDGLVQKECDCCAFLKNGGCTHAAEIGFLPSSGYEIITRTDA